MKKSEIIKKQLEATEAEYEAKAKEMVDEGSKADYSNHSKLWDNFWNECGRELSQKQEALKLELNTELNREIEVGDGVTMCLWSDRHACTVIARTAKTLTIQRDKATLDPNFKPEWIPGGFAAHCTNDHEQSWTYERDPEGEVIRCRWSEKRGGWQTGSDGSIRIIRGRHEHYDYNF